MKTIRFICSDPKAKEFVAAMRRNVNAYFKENKISTRANWKMYFKTATLIGLYLTPFILLLTVQMNYWLALSLVIIMGIGEAGIGMCVMHDAAHGAYSSKQWINSLFSSTMYLLGSNTFNWKVQHNIYHHTYTNIYGYDPDINSKAIIRLSKHAPLNKVHKLQFIYAYILYGLMTISKLFSDFGQLIMYNRNGITKAQGVKPGLEVIKLIVTKLIYFMLIIGLPIILTDYSWWQVIIGFGVLHVTAGTIMSTVFQMAHVVEGADQPLPNENGEIEQEWFVHQLNTTSDFARNSRILSWYVGGLNFQIEHHLFPNICHIHYKSIAPIVENTAKEYGYPYNLKESFYEAFVSHARILKSLGKR